MSNNNIWSTCAKCESAVIARFLNPKTRLCKVCDAYRLKEGYVQRPTAAPDMHAVKADHGQEQEVIRYSENAELDGTVYSFTEDTDGNVTIVDAEMGTAEKKALADRARKLEQRADRFLAQAENAELLQQMLKESKDPAQFIMNKVRIEAGLALRPVKEAFTPATTRQTTALKKLGWENQVLSGKLSVSDASRLLQRGPKWLQKA